MKNKMGEGPKWIDGMAAIPLITVVYTGYVEEDEKYQFRN